MNRALVTGGAGFIGSNLVQRIERATDAEVVVLDNLSSGYSDNLARCGATFIEGDVRDAECVNRAAEHCDTIFHLAASVGNTRAIDHPLEDSTINVLGTLNVLEAARQHGVRKVIYSSSAGIFGELKTLPIKEDHPIDPDTPYGVSKLAGEKHCLAYAKLYEMDCVCLRYFNVFGPHQRYDAYGNVIPIFVHRLLDGEPLTIYGDGEQTRDFIHVADVAEANLKAAAAAGVSGAFNMGSATRVTINRLVELLHEVSGVAGRVVHGPPRPGDVRHSLADIEAARQKLGFEPEQDFASGLAEYVAWVRRHRPSVRQAG